MVDRNYPQQRPFCQGNDIVKFLLDAFLCVCARPHFSTDDASLQRELNESRRIFIIVWGHKLKNYHQPRTWTASCFGCEFFIRMTLYKHLDMCQDYREKKEWQTFLYDIASDIENSWITWLETDWISKIFNATHKISLCRLFHTPAASYKCLFTWLEARGFLKLFQWRHDIQNSSS